MGSSFYKTHITLHKNHESLMTPSTGSDKQCHPLGVGIAKNKDVEMEMRPTVSSFEMSPYQSDDGIKLVSSDDGRRISDSVGDSGMPFLARPLWGSEAGLNSTWLKAGKEATAWLDLFYGTPYYPSSAFISPSWPFSTTILSFIQYINLGHQVATSHV